MYRNIKCFAPCNFEIYYCVIHQKANVNIYFLFILGNGPTGGKYTCSRVYKEVGASHPVSIVSRDREQRTTKIVLCIINTTIYY